MSDKLEQRNMKPKDKLVGLILKQGLLPLFFHEDKQVCKNVLKSLYEGGIRVVEYTNRGEQALENFEVLKKWAAENLQDMKLGIGTIKNKSQAKDFIKLGADFIISPGMADEVITEAKKNDLLWIPGCMTPSEIIAAENSGAKLVKLFPGSVLKPEFIRTIRSIFPDLYLMPTGGVRINEKNLTSWFESGVDAVGIGGDLIRKEFLEEKSYKKIKISSRETIEMIDKIKRGV